MKTYTKREIWHNFDPMHKEYVSAHVAVGLLEVVKFWKEHPYMAQGMGAVPHGIWVEMGKLAEKAIAAAEEAED